MLKTGSNAQDRLKHCALESPQNEHPSPLYAGLSLASAMTVRLQGLYPKSELALAQIPDHDQREV
jgi:hypothetical protein